MNRIFISIFLVVLAFNSTAQTRPDSTDNTIKAFVIGEITIKKVVDNEMINVYEMEKFNAHDVSTSLRALPSIAFYSSGLRNESMVFVRGFDIRSVPVFMDGIPVYVPYDGYVDLGRFTTYDISKIDVSKGFSSMMYGANTIGGAINLVGQKPTNKMEIRAEAGVMNGNGFDAKLNVGSNLGKVYIQSSFSLLNREFVPLSSKFDTTSFETDHQRDNSYRKDIKGSIKVGYTPNSANEYSINYIISHGSKGNPIYLGNDKITKVRYWQWPNWDKQSIYFISKTAVNEKTQMKIRMYYDEFKNKVSSFDDNTYTTQTKKSSFNSYYDDYTLGGNIEFSSELSEKNTLKFSAHLKNDNHSEHNEGEPVRHFADNTFSLCFEDIYKPVGKLTLIPGISYNLRKSLRAEDYDSKTQTISDLPKNTNDAFNAQLATYYNLSSFFNTNFNIAYKSRFATMKDRYSYRNGYAIPNPDLQSETALNLEFGANISIAENLILRPEFFYNRLFNTIQNVSNVQEDLSQMQNTGSSEFAGTDFSLIYKPISNIRIYAVYSFIKCQNLSNPDLLFTDIPRNKVYASSEFNFVKNLYLSVSGEYNSERFNATDGSRVSPSFAVANTEVSYRFIKYLKLKFGVNNLFDTNYTIQEGYPEMGRNFYATLHFIL